MPLILLIGLVISPRLVLALLALLTTWFASLNLLWVVLGIVFAPVTLLWVSVVINSFGGRWGVIQVLILALAIAVDFGGPYYTRSRYYIVEEVREV
jgi:fructose-specific phosphotransferase system IIC component